MVYYILVYYFIIQGLMKLQNVIKRLNERESEVYLRQAGPNRYRDVLTEMKSKDIYNVIVDIPPMGMSRFLRSVSYTLWLATFQYLSPVFYRYTYLL